MKYRKTAIALLLCILTVVALSCARRGDRSTLRLESQPPISNPSPRQVAVVERIPPPDTDEVKNTVDRIFKGTVTIDSSRDHYYLVGDFNGDHSQDLAVVVRTAPGMAAKLNDEFAPWILVDPVELARLAWRLSKQTDIDPDKIRQPVQIGEGDVLLAVIHGFESNGWRDSQATQTYVLKNAVGDRIDARSRDQLRESKGAKTPDFRGDVIEQTIGGKSGLLYYNGAKYAWYDPSIYVHGPARLMVHDRAGLKQ
jgi:hypothetical protein